ncbi:MAG: 3-oxoacyl-ACP reductase FabG [Thiobacillaceae bacterium]|nr:3-oxoacyl-ACP reductase FabG [Thiobacillaceae bacterium]
MSRVAVVTGGIGGLGTAMCKALAEQGRRPVAVDYNGLSAEVVEKWKAARKAEGLDIPVYLADVTSFESCAEVCKKIEAEIGPIDILVNNAGITRDNLLMRMKDEEWAAILDTNLSSVFRLCRAVIKPMMKARYGRIVSIASVVGAAGNAGQTNYAAAKAGMIGFSKALAQEVGSRGITVNCVAPGFIDTDMTRALPEAQRQRLLERIPLGRLGTAEEIAQAVAFLASDDAGYITGATLHVNGGMYMD